MVICAHLNMLWICFVFIREDMRAGVAVEPWDTCFLIWINWFCSICTSFVHNDGASAIVDTKLLDCPISFPSFTLVCHIGESLMHVRGRLTQDSSDCRYSLRRIRVKDARRSKAFLNQSKLPSKVELSCPTVSDAEPTESYGVPNPGR